MKTNLKVSELGTMTKVGEFAIFEEDDNSITLTFAPITYYVGSSTWMAGKRAFPEGPSNQPTIEHSEIYMFAVAAKHARELLRKKRKPSMRKPQP
jgi:hypothetical protein